jgi:trigger factor
MKSSVEQINPVQYRINVEVTGDEVGQAFAQVLRRIQKKAHLQGFRPGKAPLDMIRKFYSDQALQEVRENLIRSNLNEALSGSTLRTVAAPVIDRIDSIAVDKPFTFSAVVDTMPEIKVTGYKGLEIAVEELKYSDVMLERELKNLQQRAGKASPLATDDAKAATAMMATIGHTVSKNGEVLTQFDVKEYPVLLGSGQLLPGLEELIVGLGKGESKSGRITIPQDFNDADLAGQELDITVELKDLKDFHLPQLDGEFAKDLGFESLEELKTNVQTQIEQVIKQTNDNAVETALVNKLMTLTPVEAPPAIVDSFIDSMIREKLQSSPKINEFLKNQEVRGELRPKAREQVIKILLLLQIFNEEKLAVSDEEVRAEADNVLRQHQLSPSERKNLAQIKQRVEQSTRENLMLKKALSWLEEHANIVRTFKES